MHYEPRFLSPIHPIPNASCSIAVLLSPVARSVAFDHTTGRSTQFDHQRAFASSLSTSVLSDVGRYTLEGGFRVHDTLWDLAVAVKRDPQEPENLLSTRAQLQTHATFGVADAVLADVVGSYHLRLRYTRENVRVLFTLGLGVQLSAGFFPYLSVPIASAAPHVSGVLTISLFDIIGLSLFSRTNTLFDFSAQALTPILGGELRFQLTDALQIGARAVWQFSDVAPEAVIITSKEAGFYVTWSKNS